jgi:hypothetical protein
VSNPYTGGNPGAPAPPYGDAGLGGQAGATSYTPPTPEPQYAYGDPDQPLTEDGHPDVEGTSVGTLIGEVTRDLSTLMRQELELAKAEVRAEANKAVDEVKAQGAKAGKGAGMLAGAGYAGHLLVLFLSFALWWGLENFMDAGLAALIVAILWGIVAAVLYSMGRKQLKQVDFSRLKQVNPKPERTMETLQQVPGALKPN